MTCREKLKMEHPEYVRKDSLGGCDACPSDYGYLPDPIADDGVSCEMTCRECWDREIPEETPPKVQTATIYGVMGSDESVKTEPHIKDSGNRTEFSTGAVRDMREGKGRCDLMPLEVVRDLLDDEIIGHIANFMQTQDTRELYHALDIFAHQFGDMHTLLLEVAVHFEEGAKKYGEANYRLGIPPKCYIDSAIRHYIKWLREDEDERHDRAFVWNLMCCIWEVDHHKTKIATI